MRRRAALLTLLLLAGLVAVLVVLTWREVRQERLNQALIAAIQRNDPPAVISLLNRGAEANALAVSTENRTVWRVLLDRIRGLHTKDTSSQPALIVALNIPFRYEGFAPGYQDTTPIVKALLDRGVDVHARDNDGRTALLIAVSVRDGDEVANVRAVVACLLHHGASLYNKDRQGHTVLSLARTTWHDKQLIQMLKRAGEKEDGKQP